MDRYIQGFEENWIRVKRNIKLSGYAIFLIFFKNFRAYSATISPLGANLLYVAILDGISPSSVKKTSWIHASTTIHRPSSIPFFHNEGDKVYSTLYVIGDLLPKLDEKQVLVSDKASRIF